MRSSGAAAKGSRSQSLSWGDEKIGRTLASSLGLHISTGHVPRCFCALLPNKPSWQVYQLLADFVDLLPLVACITTRPTNSPDGRIRNCRNGRFVGWCRNGCGTDKSRRTRCLVQLYFALQGRSAAIRCFGKDKSKSGGVDGWLVLSD